MSTTAVITLSDGRQVGVTVGPDGTVGWVAERPSPGGCWGPPLKRQDEEWRHERDTFAIRDN
jgi:hypothetical protein